MMSVTCEGADCGAFADEFGPEFNWGTGPGASFQATYAEG